MSFAAAFRSEDISYLEDNINSFAGKIAYDSKQVDEIIAAISSRPTSNLYIKVRYLSLITRYVRVNHNHIDNRVIEWAIYNRFGITPDKIYHIDKTPIDEIIAYIDYLRLVTKKVPLLFYDYIHDASPEQIAIIHQRLPWTSNIPTGSIRNECEIKRSPLDFSLELLPPRPQCINQVSTSGNPIWYYSEDDLIFYSEDEKKVYCFDHNDIDYLEKTRVNPHSGKALSELFLDQLKSKDRYIVFPVDRLIEMMNGRPSCPGHRSVNPLIKYHESRHEMKSIEIPTTLKDSYVGKDKYVYRYEFDESGRKIKSVTVVYDPTTASSTPKPTPIYDIEYDDLITDWVDSHSTNLEPLVGLNIKLPTPIKAYRGMKHSDYFPFFKQDLKLHDKLTFSSPSPSSWTTNYCIAESFAQPGRGVIISAILSPDDILIDLRLVINKAIELLNEDEIVVLQGREITVTVEGLLFSIDSAMPRTDLRTSNSYLNVSSGSRQDS